jgi:hypothetical protein
MRSVVVAAIALILITGCAGPRLKPEQIKTLPDDTNILIISAVGNSFSVYEYTTFGGSKLLDSLDFWPWGLNPKLEDLIHDSLKNSRFKVYKYHEFEDKKDIKFIRDRWIEKIDMEDLKNHIIDFSEKNHIDKIIVLSENRTEWHNAMLAGYGMYRYTSLLNIGKSVGGIGYICIEMNWYDAKTMKKSTISSTYNTFGVPPEIIDNIYANGNWSLFRSLREDYLEMFKSKIDAMIARSGL